MTNADSSVIEDLRIEGEIVEEGGAPDEFPSVSWLDVDAHPVIYHVAVSDDDEGPFTAHCVELPGAVSEGATKQEACEKLREAFAMLVEDYRAAGQDVPWTDQPVEEGYRIADSIELDG